MPATLNEDNPLVIQSKVESLTVVDSHVDDEVDREF